MTGLEIFIGGGILLCNGLLVAYLLKSDKTSKVKVSEPQSENEANQIEVQPSGTVLENKDPDVVAPSKFNVDEFLEKFTAKVVEEVKKEVHTIMSSKMGEVSIDDVQFDQDYPEEDEFVPQKNIAPLSESEMYDAFNTDMRDIDDTPPSERIASGTSMDELETAMDVAMDDKSTVEQKVDAGKIIEPFKVTKLYDIVTSDEEIDRRIELCVRLAIRAEIEMKAKKPKSKETEEDAPEETQLSAKVTVPDKVSKEEEKPIVKAFDKSLHIDFDNIDPDSFDINSIIGE